jgi:hypothetical protein
MSTAEESGERIQLRNEISVYKKEVKMGCLEEEPMPDEGETWERELTQM